MQLFIHGEKPILDQFRDYLEKKLERLDRHLPDLGEVRIEMRRQKTKSVHDRNIVQVTAHAGQRILRAEERADAFEACIDAVVDKLNRQIVRYKGKRVDRWHGHLGHPPPGIEDLGPDSEMMGMLAEETEQEIVRVKRFAVQPMNQEEAVEQMELLGHDFFVFYNPDVGRMNVLYRRKDNNYGLLDPELV